VEDSRSPYEIEPPSARKLLTSSLLAVAVAAIVLTVMILPAEYGIDPTGLGTAMGLTSLSSDPEEGVTQQLAEAADGVDARGTSFYIEEMIVSDEILPEGFPKPGSVPNPDIQQTHPAAHKSETITIELEAGGMVEYKAQMLRGQVLLYSWSTDRGGVHSDFHAEPWDGPEGYWVRYKAGDNVAADHGSLVTPLDGQHGWYFHNTNDFPVVIELHLSGYFDEVVRYGF
jgi:hypothetical protein